MNTLNIYGYSGSGGDYIAESCEHEIHNRQTTPSPMPWKYLEQTGFVVDANGEYIVQTWNKQEEDFPNAIANGNAIANLTAENAALRAQLADLQRIIEYIDKKFPRADKTCDEPGITLSEAVRRTLADMDTNNDTP